MFAGFRWGFDLPNYNYVEGWSHSILSPDVCILVDEMDAQPPQFFWTSAHLNELDDGAEVLERARQLKALFDGALYLVNGLHARPVPLGTIRHFGSGARSTGYGEPAPKLSPFSKAVCARPLDRYEIRRVSDRMLEGSIYAARTDGVVFGMLASLGVNGLTFPALYALTDTMETHGMTPQEQWRAAGSTRAEWGRFTGTANNYAALGPDARHGDKGWQLKYDPMDNGRAAEIVLAATKAFISKRVIRATAMLRQIDPAANLTAPVGNRPQVDAQSSSANETPTALPGDDHRHATGRRPSRRVLKAAVSIGLLGLITRWTWRRIGQRGATWGSNQT